MQKKSRTQVDLGDKSDRLPKVCSFASFADKNGAYVGCDSTCAVGGSGSRRGVKRTIAPKLMPHEILVSLCRALFWNGHVPSHFCAFWIVVIFVQSSLSSSCSACEIRL